MKPPESKIATAWRDNDAIERALEAAFHDAVRQSRIYNLPVDMRKDGKVVYVSPFDIHLPEDDDPAMPKRVTTGTNGKH
ncbi:MAG TPA: hypothetical protein VJT67_08695 [Longimicrobiaceae bacterium]|nr:hypothetical protein [Longimicrobiaceae bacterium]